MSTLSIKELSHPAGEVLKIAAGKTLDLNSQGTVVLPTIPTSKMPAGSVIQIKEAGWDSAVAISIAAAGTSVGADLTTGVTLITLPMTVQEGSKVIALFGSGQTNASGTTTNPYVGLFVDSTAFHKGLKAEGGTHHWGYGATERYVVTMQAMTLALSAGTHTFKVQGGSYNGVTVFNYQTQNQGTLILMEIAQ